MASRSSGGSGWRWLLSTWAVQLAAVSGRSSQVSFVGATGEALSAAELRLGRALPPSLRDFYTVADGWPESGIRFGVSGLRPVSTLGWFRDLEPGWLQAWVEVDPDTDDVALMKRALVLSTPGEAAVLLDPTATDPVTGEWQAWLFDNDAPGAHSRSSTCFEVVDHVYARFLAAHGLTKPVPAGSPDPVEVAYRRVLAGDRSAKVDIDDYRQRYGWRAWLLALQVEACVVQDRQRWTANAAVYVWNPAFNIAGLSLERALADPVVTGEIMPLFLTSYVRRDGHEVPRVLRQLIAQGYRDPLEPAEFDDEVRRQLAERLDGLIKGQPSEVAAALNDLRVRFERDGGLVADFSYSQGFDSAVARARLMVRSDPVPAFELLLEALPAWEPLNPNHVAPIGLLWDTDLAVLFHGRQEWAAIRQAHGPRPDHRLITTPRAPRYRG